MTPMEKHQSQVAARVLEELKKRSMEGYYCRTAQEAADLVSSLIADGETVTFGGSMTIGETGILDALKKRTDLTILDRGEAKSPEEVQKIYRRAFSCDTYLMSANAITRDGQLVNIDGNGNRVAALCFGPKQVLVIAGMNKVSETLEEAVSRAKNTRCPCQLSAAEQGDSLCQDRRVRQLPVPRLHLLPDRHYPPLLSRRTDQGHPDRGQLGLLKLYPVFVRQMFCTTNMIRNTEFFGGTYGKNR